MIAKPSDYRVGLRPIAAIEWLRRQAHAFTLRGVKLRLEPSVLADEAAEELTALYTALRLPGCSQLQRLTLQSGAAERLRRSGWVWAWRPTANSLPFRLQWLGTAAPSLPDCAWSALVGGSFLRCLDCLNVPMTLCVNTYPLVIRRHCPAKNVCLCCWWRAAPMRGPTPNQPKTRQI